MRSSPSPRTRRCCAPNLDANACENVTLVACALATRPGTATFSLDEATGATGHLGGEPTAGELAVGTGKVHLIETPVETIDGLVERLGIVPDVIKMDIEGGEIHALAGAADTLARHRPVVLSELTGEEGAEVVRFLDEHGYTMWDLESGRPVAPGDHPFMVVAIPAERVEGDRARRVLAALKVVAG